MLGIAGPREDHVDALLVTAKSIGRFRQRRGATLFEQKAERLFLAALATAEQYGPKSTMARASGWLGVVYARAGDLRQACRYWARARSLHQELATAAAEDCVQQTEALSVDMLERSMRNARCPGS